MGIVIQLIIGAIGGNIGGALFKNLSLGPVGNSLAGIVGGILCGQILHALFGTGQEGSIIVDILGGVIGGIIVMAIVGFVKSALGKKP